MLRRGSLLLGLLCTITAFVALSAVAVAQPKLERVPAPHVYTLDGHVVYSAYCAPCHGFSARGTGMAAPLLPCPVPDLTTFTTKDGRFNRFHLASHITDPRRSGEQMPDWAEVLRQNYGSQGLATLAVHNLVDYVEALQAVSTSRP